MKKTAIAGAALLVLVSLAAGAQADETMVNLAFNRYYDHAELGDALRRLHEAFPELTRLESVGFSYQGRELWLMTISNPATGPELRKPAIYIDGNVHGNEVQASEVCLYALWYLLENYGDNERVAALVDRAVFYVLPSVNPDGRDFWLHEPNTPNTSRSGQRPVDDDRDGLFDEDGPDDLDGDGSITMMRRRDPAGRFKLDPRDPRLMVMAEPGEEGGWELLGNEGIDNDGDGVVNEDPTGYYDMNRNWGFNWMPNYIQTGAGEYPYSHPETRSINEFLLAHPNILAVQSFHNSGGMILRGPGAKNLGEYPFADVRVYDYLGERGERMLTGYDYLISYKDLYTVYGGFLDWCYRSLGAFAFTNELYRDEQEDVDGEEGVDEHERLRFDDYLRFGAGYREWEPYDHPTYGAIEIGGWTKMTQRVPPPWLLEELCHRNAAFTIFHAESLPLLRFRDVEVERLDSGLFRVAAAVANEQAIPTRSAQAVQNRLGRPDIAMIEGDDVEIISAGTVTDRYHNVVDAQELDLARLRVPALGGMSEVRLQWIVRGGGDAVIVYDSQKGGRIEREIELR